MKRNTFANNYKIFASVLHMDLWYVIFTFIVRIVTSIRTSFLYVYLLGFVLSFVETGKPLGFIIKFILAGTVLLAVSFAIEAYYNNIFKPIHSEKIVRRMQLDILDKLHKADIKNFDSEELYTTVLLANSEAATRPLAVIDNLFGSFECLLTTGIIVVGAAITDWVILLICAVSFVVGILLTNINVENVVRYDTLMKEKDKKLSFLSRYLYLPEYIKENRISKIHDNLLTSYKKTIEDKQEIVRESGKRISRLDSFRELFCSAFCIDFLVPLYLSLMILFFHRMEISSFVIAVNACYQIQQRFDSITNFASEFVQNGRYIERLNDINRIDSSIENAVGNIPSSSVQFLSFDNVSFFYPDGKFGVTNINFTIEKGSKIAIVGRNGSGKSTLVKLLLRLYDPTVGAILQNGVDIKSFDISAYREQFSVAFQDFNLYATSLKNNICMGGNEDAEKLSFVLEKAELSDEVADSDVQLTREFSDAGIMFSGGQEQRLVLARVFYKDTEVIVMDEPTAAMDILFERKFYNLLFETLKEKTVIFISHRLSSVTACDKILYMENGRILEEGTHDELIFRKGAYYELFRAQFD